MFFSHVMGLEALMWGSKRCYAFFHEWQDIYKAKGDKAMHANGIAGRVHT